jgi:hypothetical protein
MICPACQTGARYMLAGNLVVAAASHANCVDAHLATDVPLAYGSCVCQHKTVPHGS